MPWTRTIRISLFPLLLAGSVSAQESAPPELADARAAVEIDGRRVPLEELACWLVRYQGEQHVGDFVKRRALERAAAAEGVLPTDEEVPARWVAVGRRGAIR